MILVHTDPWVVSVLLYWVVETLLLYTCQSFAGQFNQGGMEHCLVATVPSQLNPFVTIAS